MWQNNFFSWSRIQPICGTEPINALWNSSSNFSFISLTFFFFKVTVYYLLNVLDLAFVMFPHDCIMRFVRNATKLMNILLDVL